MVIVKLKDGRTERFEESYAERCSVEYVEGFVIVTNSRGTKRTSFPTADVESLTQDRWNDRPF
jgi:hypothetical protein